MAIEATRADSDLLRLLDVDTSKYRQSNHATNSVQHSYNSAPRSTGSSGTSATRLQDVLHQRAADGGSNLTISQPNEGHDFSQAEIVLLQNATEKAHHYHQRQSGGMTDTLNHRGIMRSLNAGYFLKNVYEITQGKPMKLPKSFSNADMVGLMKAFLPSIASMEAHIEPRKDYRLLAMAVAGMVIDKASRKERLTADQANDLAAAAAAVKVVTQFNGDMSSHSRPFTKEWKRSAVNILAGSQRVFEGPRKHVDGESNLGGVLGLIVGVVPAAIGGTIDAAFKMAKKDKPRSHALDLLSKSIEQIPAGKISDDVLAACMELFSKVESTHEKGLYRCLIKKVTFEQREPLQAAWRAAHASGGQTGEGLRDPLLP